MATFPRGDLGLGLRSRRFLADCSSYTMPFYLVLYDIILYYTRLKHIVLFLQYPQLLAMTA